MENKGPPVSALLVVAAKLVGEHDGPRYFERKTAVEIKKGHFPVYWYIGGIAPEYPIRDAR